LSRPDRLVDVGRADEGRGFDTASYPNFLDLRARTRTLTGLYAYNIEPTPVSLGGAGDAERIYGTLATANYFQVLGTRPALGRLLEDGDDRPNAGRVAVISYPLCQRKFHGDPGILGTTVAINGAPFAVVGVTPSGFQGTTLLRADVWTPMSTIAESIPRLSA